MNTEPKDYFTYLLRLWPEGASANCAVNWRATLEDARSGERLGFASLEQLFAHLMQLVEAQGQFPSEEVDQPTSTKE